MKILIAMFLAAVPAALSAQSVGNTLEMVQDLSISAAVAPGLAVARENAAKPFSSQHQVPPAVGHQTPGHQNPGNQNNPGHQTPPGHQNPGHNNPGHNNPGNHNGHQPPPVVVHPTYPLPPPYHPGYNDPFNPYNPGHPGYYPPSGPGHQHTSPVVSHPVDAKTALIVTAVVVALVLLLLLV